MKIELFTSDLTIINNDYNYNSKNKIIKRFYRRSFKKLIKGRL